MLDFEGLGEERLLLAVVHRLGAGGGTGSSPPAGVADFAADGAFEAREDVGPSAHVERFLLAPDEVRGVRILADDGLDHLPVERIELLDADDGGVFDALLLAVRHEVVVNLAAAENDAADIAPGCRRSWCPAGFPGSRCLPGNRPRARRLPARPSRLLGVIRTSGLRNARCFWRRSAWKYWAGVVKLPTCMFFSAQSWRKRSRRALECSGPCLRSRAAAAARGRSASATWTRRRK